MKNHWLNKRNTLERYHSLSLKYARNTLKAKAECIYIKLLCIAHKERNVYCGDLIYKLFESSTTAYCSECVSLGSFRFYRGLFLEENVIQVGNTFLAIQDID